MMNATVNTPKDHFRVQFFAGARSYTSVDLDSFQAPLPLGKLFGLLEERYPGIKENILSSCLVTVNLDYVPIPGPGDDQGPQIKAGDEVAIIPPVSSG
ncbi:Molybdopterin synthase sulfur carrier subunit [Colletotrichum sidae]|uniref:Molybdopterin synthase sulfur carrier subunit n=1 Tax=Colletotrichum sidae TaxID=1347389 RepID=A0A4R8TRJ3_9PEZI|nr:Molybdopterin synthase sulfur carrier subunit [Colletotrichum sidae]